MKVTLCAQCPYTRRDLAGHCDPDAILHLSAASGGVGLSAARPATLLRDNVLMTINMLEAARETGARFVFASTGGALYGDAEILPTPESYPAWPVSP